MTWSSTSLAAAPCSRSWPGLAARLGTSQPAIAKIENAERPLRPELTAQACAEFAVPEAFFAVPPSLLDVSFPTFRKRSGARAADERRIVRLGREAARAFEAASLSSGYHEVSLPDDLPTMDPEAAAVALRTDSGIDADAPILNVTRFLERLGFGVVTLLEPRPSIEPPAHWIDYQQPPQPYRRSRWRDANS